MHRFSAAHAAALCVLVGLATAVQPAGAQAWDDPRTMALVERATQGRAEQLADSTLVDYRATAHGYLTLSLVNQFLPQVVEVRGIAMGVNYGLNRVRFPTPVPVGSRVRGGVELTGAEEVPGGVQTTMVVTVEIDGAERPACVAEVISRYLA